MRQIEINYKPSWMVVRVHKAAQNEPTKPTEPILDVTPLWVGAFKYFNPIMNEDDWIRWREQNLPENERERWEED